MVPSLLLKALAKANSFIGETKEKFKGASEELDDNEPDLEDSGQPAEMTDSDGKNDISNSARVQTHKIQPLKGAGTEVFKDLAPSVLEFWLDVVKAMRPEVETEPTKKTEIVLPKDTQVSGITVEAAAGTDVDVEENVNAAVVEQHKEDDMLWDFLWLVLLGVISYYGVKLVKKGGEWVIQTSADGIKKILREFSHLEQHKIMRIESLNLNEQDGGIGRMLLDTDKYRISTPYKAVDSYHPKGHTGVDYAIDEGTNIRTALSGIVTVVRKGSESAGNYVEVASPNGFVQRFLHMRDIDVEEGQHVGIGDVLGTVGSTGKSTGAHLHYEVYAAPEQPKVGESVYNRPEKYTLLDPKTLAEYLQKNAAQAGIVKASDRPDYMMAQASFSGNMELPKKQSATARGYNYMSVTTTGNNKWQGETGSTSNKVVTLATFSSPEFGWRAGMKNLLNYQVKHDVSGSGGQYTTIADIASNAKGHSYVSSKNGDNVERWAENVSKGSGFKTTDRIDLRDADTLARVAQGIGLAEHSVKTKADYLKNIIRTFNITDGPASNKQ